MSGLSLQSLVPISFPNDVLGRIMVPNAPNLKAITPMRLVCKQWRYIIDTNITLAKTINAKRLYPVNCEKPEQLMATLLKAEKLSSVLRKSLPTIKSFPEFTEPSFNFSTSLVCLGDKLYYQYRSDLDSVYDHFLALDSIEKKIKEIFSFVGLCQLSSHRGIPICILKQSREGRILVYDLVKKEYIYQLQDPLPYSITFKPFITDNCLVHFCVSERMLFLANLQTDLTFIELPISPQYVFDVKSIDQGKKILFVLKCNEAPEQYASTIHFNPDSLMAVEYDLGKREILSCYPIGNYFFDVGFRIYADSNIKIVTDNLIAIQDHHNLWKFVKDGMLVQLTAVEKVETFISNDRFLMTTDKNGILSVFDLHTLDPIRTIKMPPPGFPSTDVASICQLYNEFVITIPPHGDACLWNIETGTLVKRLDLPQINLVKKLVSFQDGTLWICREGSFRDWRQMFFLDFDIKNYN